MLETVDTVANLKPIDMVAVNDPNIQLTLSQQDYLLWLDNDRYGKINLFKQKLPTWDGKGYKVRNSKERKTIYAYNNDVEQSHCKGWDELYINPKDRHLTCFTAIIDKEDWTNIPFKYQWFDRKYKRKVNQHTFTVTNKYNLRYDTNDKVVLFWALDKPVYNTDVYDDCKYQENRFFDAMEELDHIMSEYRHEIIWTGYIPNPFYYRGSTIIGNIDSHRKQYLRFRNLYKEEFLIDIKAENAKKANSKRQEDTLKHILKIKTDKPLSIRKLANLAKVSTRTIQNHKDKLRELKLLK